MPRVIKKIAKVGGAGLVIAATGGAGAAAAIAMKKKIEGTTYNSDRWGPLKEDASMVGIHYSPAAALDTSDFVTISGTPFDGRYPVNRARTRNDVWVKPAKPITETGTSGSFKVQTSIPARLRHLGAGTTAAVRTTGTKTVKAVKKGVGFVWSMVKRALIFLVVALVLYMIVTTVIKAKVTQAVTPAA